MEGSEKMSKKLALAFCALFLVASTPALADDDRRGRDRHWHGDYDRDDDRDRGRWHAKHYKHYKHHKHHGHGHARQHVVWHSDRHWVPPGHRKHHKKKVVVHHHYGHDHKHHRDYRRDNDWAIYAILALQIVDVLNESQRDHYAWAQQRAYNAPIGETIQWHDGGASGSVIPVREGSDRGGRYCREFQQQVVVGNRSQAGYGVACRQPDGAWQIVSN